MPSNFSSTAPSAVQNAHTQSTSTCASKLSLSILIALYSICLVEIAFSLYLNKCRQLFCMLFYLGRYLNFYLVIKTVVQILLFLESTYKTNIKSCGQHINSQYFSYSTKNQIAKHHYYQIPLCSFLWIIFNCWIYT